MGKIVNIDEAQALEGVERDWAYNALDCTGPLEIARNLLPRLDKQTQRTYEFELAMQGPALAMMRRGVLVDDMVRAASVAGLRREIAQQVRAVNALPLLVEKWDGWVLNTGKCKKSRRKDGRHSWPRGVPDGHGRLCEACGASRIARAEFNPNSADQVNHLFYSLLALPKQRNKKGKFSVDEDVLERIGRRWPAYKALTDAFLSVRDLAKQIGFLSARLTPDSRFPSSFNVGTAWTGRWSSSKNPEGYGSNLQNVAERHRNIFIADPGMELFYADLEQAESRAVAYLSGDEAYIEAHLSGDVHTFACRRIWPDLPWTGDMARDKAIAKASPPWDPVPGHDWRFQAKRIQHGSNYGLSPQGIAMIAHIPLREARVAYRAYFEAFPKIKAWHRFEARAVEGQEPLVNPLGRRCRLFGRPWDAHTFKQGLAFKPQSLVADVLNVGLWRVWRELDPKPILLLSQVYDAIMGEWPVGARMEAARAVARLMLIPIPITDIYGVARVMVIPVEVSAGANWRKFNDDDKKGPLNLGGQRKIEL